MENIPYRPGEKLPISLEPLDLGPKPTPGADPEKQMSRETYSKALREAVQTLDRISLLEKLQQRTIEQTPQSKAYANEKLLPILGQFPEQKIVGKGVTAQRAPLSRKQKAETAKRIPNVFGMERDAQGVIRPQVQKMTLGRFFNRVKSWFAPKEGFERPKVEKGPKPEEMGNDFLT